MDIRCPPVVWCNGSAYRVTKAAVSQSSATRHYNEDEFSDYEQELQEEEECGSTSDRDQYGADGAHSLSLYDVTVESADRDQYTMCVNIPRPLYGSVIGRAGRTLRQVELRHNCRVEVPRSHSAASAGVTVKGTREGDVRAACGALAECAERMRRSIAPSHFVGFRLESPAAAAADDECGGGSGDALRQRYAVFCRQVMALGPVSVSWGPAERGSGATAAGAGGPASGATAGSLAERLLQRPDRLHLTVCVLTLLSASERRRLCHELQQHLTVTPSSCSAPGEAAAVVDEGPAESWTVRLRGIDVMNDDPSEASVLYARVCDDDNTAGTIGKLQRLADSIATRLAGVAGGPGPGTQQRHTATAASVKLHCTLMNTAFLVHSGVPTDDTADTHTDHHHQQQQQQQGRQRSRATFDASAIMQQLGDFDFGTAVIDRVHVLQRHSFAKDGFYTALASFPLSPSS